VSDGPGPHSLDYGKPPMGRVRGSLALAARWGSLPAGLILCLACTYVGVTTGATWVYVGVYAGAPLAFFGLVAFCAGLSWRRRGQMLRGVRFRMGATPEVQLDLRVRTRTLPLSALEIIEVHAMTEWADMYDPDPRNRDTPPWLRLRFRTRRGRRSGWYCLMPVHLTGAPAAESLRGLLAGTDVTVVDIRRDDRARAGLSADRSR
jgi:hypothetical protein